MVYPLIRVMLYNGGNLFGNSPCFIMYVLFLLVFFYLPLPPNNAIIKDSEIFSKFIGGYLYKNEKKC